MILQQKVLNHFNRRTVKYQTINVMGLAGLVIAIIALIIAQDQSAMLMQVTEELMQTPIGSLFTSITSFF
jgi:hypothetical protein